VDYFISSDFKKGRMVDTINKGEPAIMATHWPAIYYNGQETGFKVFQEVVKRLHTAYDNLVWMKLSEIARYWAAKELTTMQRGNGHISFNAPYECPGFTIRVASQAVPKLGQQPLVEVSNPLQLKSGTWTRQRGELMVCFDLKKGASRLDC
jgi:hypothetical protein